MLIHSCSVIYFAGWIDKFLLRLELISPELPTASWHPSVHLILTGSLPPGHLVTAKFLPSLSLVAVKKHVQHSEHPHLFVVRWGKHQNRHFSKCKETAETSGDALNTQSAPSDLQPGTFPSQRCFPGRWQRQGHKCWAQEELAPVQNLEGSLASCFVWSALFHSICMEIFIFVPIFFLHCLSSLIWWDNS